MKKTLLFLIVKFPKGSIWQTRYLCFPLAIASSTWGFARTSISFGVCISWFLSGILAWTLLEYMMHRFFLHWNPKAKISKALLERFHIMHHHNPLDQSQVCIPFILSGTFWIFVYTVALSLGAHSQKGLLLISAVFLMMTIYDIAHYSAHYMPATNPYLRLLKKHHMLHHFSDHTKRFGVTSPFWDYVFWTV